MRVSIFLFASFFVLISCKRLEKKSATLLTTSSANINVKDSLPKEEQQQEQQRKEGLVNIKLDTLKTIDLPIGSELLISYKFPKKFGLEGEAYMAYFDGEREVDAETKSLLNAINQNRSYLTSNSLKKEYLEATLVYDYFYKLVPKDTIYNKKNIKVIGEITHDGNHFVLCSIVHNTVPLYSSIHLYSIDDNNTIKDALVLFDRQEDYLSHTNELFYINNSFLITKKYFKGFEGITLFEGEEFYTTNPEGYFIRHYSTNGNYKNEREQGLVENNGREGLWILKNDLDLEAPGHPMYIEANYKDGIPIGIWKYYHSTSKGEKGRLLFKETYINGELSKREFVEN